MTKKVFGSMKCATWRWVRVWSELSYGPRGAEDWRVYSSEYLGGTSQHDVCSGLFAKLKSQVIVAKYRLWIAEFTEEERVENEA